MNNPNSNYDLPPIRKIGPAVLPKPKNIKIQAGRVVRFNQEHDLNNLDIDYVNDFVNQNSDFVINQQQKQQQQQQTKSAQIQPPDLLMNNLADRDVFLKKIPKNGINEANNITNSPQPHRARLVQIPNKLEEALLFNRSFENSSPILSTSQLKFPRKSSIRSSSPPNSAPPAPPLNGTTIPISRSFIGNNSIPTTYIQTNNEKSIDINQPTTINFSSDGSTNRPTITITATRNANSPTLNYKQIHHPQPIENDFSSGPSSSNGLSYNIPIQYVQQSPSQSPYQAPNTNFLPTSSRNNLFMSNQDKSNNINSNTTYTIPVNMALSNNNSNNSLINKTNLLSNTSNTTNDIDNYNLNSTGNLLNKQQFDLKQMNNFKGLNSAMNNMLTNNMNEEDEVDLLKDLLMKNLNSSNDPNFYGICMKCSEKIYGADNGLRAMDQLFHVKCFVCHGCGYSLQGQHFYAMENKSFCENCYMRLLERCSLCSKPITDRILRATGKPFHPECFCCIVCEKNLDGVPFTVDASNKIHCIECFHEKYAPRCYICHLSITPEHGQEETVRIVAMDKSFHINCYKCEDCGISLSSNAENAGGCFPLDDHIFCKNCNIQRIRKLLNNQEISTQELNASQKSLSNKRTQQALNVSSSSNLTPRSTDL